MTQQIFNTERQRQHCHPVRTIAAKTLSQVKSYMKWKTIWVLFHVWRLVSSVWCLVSSVWCLVWCLWYVIVSLCHCVTSQAPQTDIVNK